MRIAPHSNNVFSLLLAAAAALIFASGCGPGNEGSPTSGRATVYTSEDLYPIMELESQAFQKQYESATINLLVASQRQAIAHLINDSVKLVIVSRWLTPEESDVVKKNNIQIDSVRVAYDGIVVLANAYSGLKHITVAQLAAFASGASKNLKSAGGTASEQVMLAFGGRNSEMKDEVSKRLIPGHVLTESVAPCTSSTHAIQFVSEHPSALGFISLAWSKQLPKNVTVLDIGDPAFKRLPYLDTLEYFAPHPAHIYRNYYPLRRSVYLLSRGIHVNVDKGFLAFLAGREGQSVINKFGLVPATQPVKLVP
ncbi:MAG TPA: substrate-binding domain-containing protein [Bacteroidota bacterium]|nr:substrate-binding domain-containing protein [Bacteroidota bacterium]